MNEPLRRSRIEADPVNAVDAFDSLMWGDPGVSLGYVRREYRAVAQWLRSGGDFGARFGETSEHQIIRCALLGIDPVTGEEATKQAGEIIAEYEKKKGRTGLQALHARYLESPFIKRALQQESLER